MGPAEQYIKARRTLVVLLGLLGVSIFVGFSEREGTHLSIFPFRLDNPEYIPHLLALAVLYSVYNLGYCWAMTENEPRAATIIWRDFTLKLFVTALLLLIYAVWKIEIPAAWDLGAVVSWSGALGVVAGFTTVMAAVYFVNVRLRRQLRDQEDLARSRAQREHLTNVLLNENWVLTFNEGHPKGFKKIKFHADGTIGEGQNQNEARWEIEGGELVIWREGGDLQNRFRYEDPIRSFISTDDPSADAVRRGYKGQTIAPDEPESD